MSAGTGSVQFLRPRRRPTANELIEAGARITMLEPSEYVISAAHQRAVRDQYMSMSKMIETAIQSGMLTVNEARAMLEVQRGPH